MKSMILELWYKYKVRALRLAISKITAVRRKLNTKQKKLTQSVDKYSVMYKDISKL